MNTLSKNLLSAIAFAAALSACTDGPRDSVVKRAVNDAAATSPSTAVTIDVLANDRAGSLLDSFQASSTNGTIVRDENGTPSDTSDDKLVYTPNGGFEGTDNFTYTTTDANGANTSRATVTVTVSDAGQAVDDLGITVVKDSQNNDLDVLRNDSENMRVTAVESPTTNGGTVTIASGGTSVLYTPAAGYTGPDDFGYTAQRTVDGQVESDTAEVQLTVEAPEPPSNACRTDPAARLIAGVGYCYDAQLTTTNGALIDFTVFVPHPKHLRANAEATTGVPLDKGEPGFAPLLIHSHGFGGEKYPDFSEPATYLDSHIAKLAWESGYFVITFTQRGFGGPQGGDDGKASGEQIGLMRPDLEGFDFVDLVNWAVVHLRENFNFDDPGVTDSEFDANNSAHTNPNVTPDAAWGRSLLLNDSKTRLSSATLKDPLANNPALATIGYSWGGLFQFNAQSVDPRVDAMIPMGTGFDLRYTLASNDTPKTAWVTIMTAFAGQGGNGEPLPPLLTDGNSEMNGANKETDDAPHNKARQISIKNYKKLGPSGPVAYCDGNASATPADDPGFGDVDKGTNQASELTFPQTTPPNGTRSRAVRAHLLMIQGYNDTLFNFNEGLDNARCWESQAPRGTDVRLLQQTSGHPLPELGPAHYAGSDSSMYLDEIVHCGLDGGVPKKYVMRDVGLSWYDFHLRGILPPDTNGDKTKDADDIFPRACITQTNTNTNLKLRTGAANPEFSGSNTSSTAYKFSREGAVFNSIAAIPAGCAGAATNCASLVVDTTTFGPQGVITGPNPDPNGANAPQQFLPLYTVPAGTSQVLAGIPLANLSVTRQNPSAEEIVYVGIGVRRCNANSADNNGTGLNCETVPSQVPLAPDSPLAAELLHFQVSPLRVFPTPAADASAQTATTSAPFPKEEPRNTGTNNPPHYPIRFGDDPAVADTVMLQKGRLVGVSARLHAGDQVGLIFFGEHPVYKTISSNSAGSLTINGTLELPLLDASTAPTNIPTYVESSAAD